MEELLFRAWNAREKQMQEFSLFDIACSYDCGYPVLLYIDNPFKFDVFYEEDRIIIMQYSNLKDEANTKLFDGDVCYDEHFEEYGKIVFEEGAFMFVRKGVIEPLSECNESIIKVGNIYENSEFSEMG